VKRLDDLTCPEGISKGTPRWSDGLVLVCAKCSGQQHGQSSPEVMPSWDTWKLRTWLKERLVAEGLWPKVRVLTASCMGICVTGRITCALGGDAAGGGEARVLVVDPEQDAEALLQVIKDSLEP
jgi:predicted metal-binding protein